MGWRPIAPHPREKGGPHNISIINLPGLLKSGDDDDDDDDDNDDDRAITTILRRMCHPVCEGYI